MKPSIGQGDKGETSLFGVGKKVTKDSLRVIAYGEVDELNSFIGLARSFIKDKRIDSILEKIQNNLFAIGSDLASPKPAKTIPKISKEEVKDLEKSLIDIENELEPLSRFILPTGSITASVLHVARAVCRRIERCTVRLSKETKINEDIIPYINRLSDVLFALARYVNKKADVSDVEWHAK